MKATRQVEERIAQALEPLGFQPSRKAKQALVVKSVEGEAEIYLYPGVGRRKGKILVEPVIGLDFLPLRNALEEMDSNPTAQVCHCILGLVDKSDLWLCLELNGDVIEADALEKIVTSVHKALAELLPLCSAKKIRELLENTIHLRYESDSGFVVMQEHLKLEVLDRLMSERHFGVLH